MLSYGPSNATSTSSALTRSMPSMTWSYSTGFGNGTLASMPTATRGSDSLAPTPTSAISYCAYFADENSSTGTPTPGYLMVVTGRLGSEYTGCWSHLASATSLSVSTSTKSLVPAAFSSTTRTRSSASPTFSSGSVIRLRPRMFLQYSVSIIFAVLF